MYLSLGRSRVVVVANWNTGGLGTYDELHAIKAHSKGESVGGGCAVHPLA